MTEQKDGLAGRLVTAGTALESIRGSFRNLESYIIGEPALTLQEKNYLTDLLIRRNLLKDELPIKKTTLTSLIRDKDNLTSQLTQADTQLNTLTAEKDNLDNRLVQAVKDLKTLTEEKNKLDNELWEVNRSLDTLTEEKNKLDNELAEVNKKLENSRKEKNKLDNELVEVNGNLDTLTTQKNDLSNQLGNLLTAVDTDLTNLKKQRDLLHGQLTIASRDLEAIIRDYDVSPAALEIDCNDVDNLKFCHGISSIGLGKNPKIYMYKNDNDLVPSQIPNPDEDGPMMSTQTQTQKHFNLGHNKRITFKKNVGQFEIVEKTNKVRTKHYNIRDANDSTNIAQIIMTNQILPVRPVENLENFSLKLKLDHGSAINAYALGDCILSLKEHHEHLPIFYFKFMIGLGFLATVCDIFEDVFEDHKIHFGVVLTAWGSVLAEMVSAGFGVHAYWKFHNMLNIFHKADLDVHAFRAGIILTGLSLGLDLIYTPYTLYGHPNLYVKTVLFVMGSFCNLFATYLNVYNGAHIHRGRLPGRRLGHH